ncbi:hypothetical protein SLE2022_138940 [Rubroshorea leprosula]
MSKLNWRMHTEKGKVWREVIVQKYKISGLKSPLPTLGSPMIKSLSKGVNLFKEGIKWTPRDGQSILFWSDHWIGHAPLDSIYFGPFSANTASITLAEAFHEGVVDMDVIGYHLDLNIINTLRATPLSITDHLPNTFSWKGEANGLFSSASALKILKSRSTCPSNDWRWIWKAPTLPKICYFFLLLYHGRIKSMEFLHSLGIVQDPICRICNGHVESLDHIFRGCPFSVAVLNMLFPGILDRDQVLIHFKDWLKCQATNMSPSTIHCLPWAVVFCFAIWMIWNQRNHFLYQGSQVTVHALVELIVERAAEFWASQPASSSCKMKQPLLIAWDPPPPEWIKLNTDGSVIGNPVLGGCGGVFRDSQGQWVLGFTRNIGFTTALAAKLWAIKDGLQLAFNLHFNHIIIETDCYVAFQLISTTPNPHHPLGTLILDCRALLNKIPHARLRHVFRESNMVADTMAKRGAQSSSNFTILYNCPTDVELLCLADVVGVGYPRT